MHFLEINRTMKLPQNACKDVGRNERHGWEDEFTETVAPKTAWCRRLNAVAHSKGCGVGAAAPIGLGIFFSKSFFPV